MNKELSDLEILVNAIEDTFDAIANGSLYKEAVQSELDRIEGIVSAEYFEGFEQGLEDGYKSMANSGLDLIKELKKQI